MATAIVSLIDEKLPMQLDSVSWNKKFGYLALGAYMIDPDNSSKRLGQIFLIKLKLDLSKDQNKNCDDRKDNEVGVGHSIEQKIDLDGVLDLRWEPTEQRKLAVATSSTFELYELKDSADEAGHSLSLSSRIKLDLDAMALYTQWVNTERLLFSDSLGAINVVNLNKFEIHETMKVHDNLTWVVQCCPANNLVFAGSDEGKFTGFLLENMQDEERHYTKKFEVGVTSIIFLDEGILAVGSYDDTLRIFAIDSLDPICLSLKRKIDFGGAVWRTVAFPKVIAAEGENNEGSMTYYIVAACARNGIHIISLDRSTWGFEKLKCCMDYEGYLAYGLDVMMQTEEKDKPSITFTIASCYFDNHRLHMWQSNIPLT